jgi:integrase/recombinase XerD
MTSISEAKGEFIKHCKYEKKLSEKTQKFYGIDLDQFLQFLKIEESELSIEKIDKTTLRNYLYKLSDFKPKTIKRKIATLKAFFNFLEFEDRIVVNRNCPNPS